MIYYLISPSYINVVTFASILFAFAVTCLAIYMGKNILPRDGGRAYAINGSKSVGNPYKRDRIVFCSVLQWL